MNFAGRNIVKVAVDSRGYNRMNPGLLWQYHNKIHDPGLTHVNLFYFRLSANQIWVE